MNDRLILYQIIMATVCVVASTLSAASPIADIGKLAACYNVVWNSPSRDAAGVMPIGNGDIAAGVYAIENGDLYLLLSKNDAYTYQGDLFKTGRVRIALDPNPFQSGRPFRQTLDLATGSIHIEADGIDIRIWADANRELYHVEVHSPQTLTVTARPEFWKRFDHCEFNYTQTYSQDVAEPAIPVQDVLEARNGQLVWYYAVGDHSIYPDDLKYYDVEPMASRFSDPFRFNTFGNLLESPQLSLKDAILWGQGTAFDIRIHALTMQTPDPKIWVKAIERQAAHPTDLEKDWKAHEQWWSAFWNRSWIIASDDKIPVNEQNKLYGEAGADGFRHEDDGAALSAQSYNVFRFLMACQGRGKVPVKFNGGLFTQQFHQATKLGLFGKQRPHLLELTDGTFLSHEDDRDWGRRFTFQNQRLLYWPMLSSGDFDLVRTFLNYYTDMLPMRQAITRAWFGHDGAYYRENIEPDGAERDCGGSGKPPKTKPGETYQGWYHDYYFTCGLEMTAMMIDYVDYTGDTTYRDEVLFPFAREILSFYDHHYQRDSKGKLKIEPAQVVETWWIATNPAPDIAGLRFCLDQLLKMEPGKAADRANWQRFRAEIPDIPLETIDGRTAIAPAEKYEKNKNTENGELYPVFPFRCFGIGLGTEAIVDWTMRHRTSVDANDGGCWSQDQIQWALAGNAGEAAVGLVRRFRIASTMARFPLYGREGPDSCPDFDHFGSGSIALQRMLVQEAGGKIFLLPAWPAKWNVDFKLHLTDGGTISGLVKDGVLKTWAIDPSSRRADVNVGVPQP